jgi:hypothetical protein
MRAALDGNFEWKCWMRKLRTAAEAELPVGLWCRGIFWDVHWLSPPFAFNLERAAAGVPAPSQASIASAFPLGSAAAAVATAQGGGVQAKATDALETAMELQGIENLFLAKWQKATSVAEVPAGTFAGIEKKLLSKGSQARACALKTFLNAWVTTARLHVDVLPCVFEPGGVDSMAHYLQCEVFARGFADGPEDVSPGVARIGVVPARVLRTAVAFSALHAVRVKRGEASDGGDGGARLSTP